MKKSNKSWIQQLSEAANYVVKSQISEGLMGLGYLDSMMQQYKMHSDIDTAHARLVPEHAGQVKAMLNNHVKTTGKALDHDSAIGLVAQHFVDNNPDWQNAAAHTYGNAGDYSGFNGEELYLTHLAADTRPSK